MRGREPCSYSGEAMWNDALKSLLGHFIHIILKAELL